MFFGEKSSKLIRGFSGTDLLDYVETLLRESRHLERAQESSLYNWLKSRPLQDLEVEQDLAEFRTMTQKMTSENCAAIAVKLDTLMQSANLTTTPGILSALRSLLDEQYIIQVLKDEVKRAKDTKNKKVNKVQPELLPLGRQATVTFILEDLNSKQV